jgi:TolB-like protein/DNA-binding winged helix-turn-helix (wHTH) protein
MDLPVASTATQRSSPRSARFGSFQVDFCARKLFSDGVEVHVQHHSWQILGMLLERPGEVITREEMRERLWDSGTFVDFDQGLNTAVMRLRHAIEDAAETPRFIETLPRHGYRFVAPVIFSDAPAQQGPHLVQFTERHDLESEVTNVPPLAQSAPARKDWGARSRLMWTFALIGLGVVVMFLARGSLRGPMFRGIPHLTTLAVLPFDNLSDHADRNFLAEGITEQLITELGQGTGFRVLSRGSVMPYVGKHVSLEKAALELQADAILEGSVYSGGGRIRVTANLYQVATRKHLWAETYEGDVGDGLWPQRMMLREFAQKIEAALARR